MLTLVLFVVTRMRRHELQPDRPAAGYAPVSLFNQRKRNRIPLKSAPCENEFFSHSEYVAASSSAAPPNISGTYGCYKASGPSSAPQSHQWNRQAGVESAKPQQYYSNRPAPGPSPPTRTFASISHPYNTGAKSAVMGQSSGPVRQDSSSGGSFSHRKYQSPYSEENSQSKPAPRTGFSQMGQQTPHRPPISTLQHSQQPAPPRMLSAPALPPPKKSWKFTNSFELDKSSFGGKRSSNQPQTAQPTKTKETLPIKLAAENSLRILTASIEGMRHWSQFKNKVPLLFEIFATLDSAVTLGCYGAKSFLLRDGKEVLQCVYYENDRVLPRLIRGQVHRCVGNYDRVRDVLICMSVRPGLTSEQRNAQEAVKASDAEMRSLVKKLCEV
uniref:Spermatogenesis associated 22 n=1 Tax=Iconisemion striatum TaxID=60296 RepID=A0A1A7YEZ9_9TELE